MNNDNITIKISDIELFEKLREAQKTFFKTRSQRDLHEAQKFERLVDARLVAIKRTIEAMKAFVGEQP